MENFTVEEEGTIRIVTNYWVGSNFKHCTLFPAKSNPQIHIKKKKAVHSVRFLLTTESIHFKWRFWGQSVNVFEVTRHTRGFGPSPPGVRRKEGSPPTREFRAPSVEKGLSPRTGWGEVVPWPSTVARTLSQDTPEIREIVRSGSYNQNKSCLLMM